MKKAKELKELRTSKIQAQQAIVDGAEKRDLNEEETTRFDAIQTEIEELTAQIERAEKLEANQRASAAKAGVVIDEPKGPAIVESTKNKRFSLNRALFALASGKQLTGIDAEVNERGIAEMKEQGLEVGEGLRINLPADLGMQSRAQTTINSGALIASTPELVMPLMPNIDVLRNLGVNIMQGLVGDVPLPTSGLFSFAHVAETADVAVTDVTFAGPTLKPHRCAGVGALSNKFLRQSSINAENYLRTIINNAYGVTIITDFINGAGGDAPTGLYSLITSNIDTTATAPTKAIVTALESLVDAVNGTKVNRGYLSDTKLANKMKNTLLDAGSGRFLFDGAELNSYKYERSSLTPTLGAGVNHPLIFGDWAQATVGYFGNVAIMVDPYTLASKSQVRLIIEGFDDVAVTNEKAFAINKVLTI